jgi:hypothetical protein
MKLDTLQHAEMVQQLVTMRNTIDTMLVILLPDVDDGPCTHPRALVVDESTMGEPAFRCSKCGLTQDTPFHEE